MKPNCIIYGVNFNNPQKSMWQICHDGEQNILKCKEPYNTRHIYIKCFLLTQNSVIG